MGLQGDAMKNVYITIFKYGGVDTICTRHTSIKAARESIRKCEKRGGSLHVIWKVTVVK